jgi:excinuclease ABC subunit C
MRFDIGLCSGPCEGKISKSEYLANVKNAEMVLKGKTKAVIDILDKKMKAFSRDKDFERALEIREQVRAIRDLGEKQKMERNKTYDEDFINWIVDSSDKNLSEEEVKNQRFSKNPFFGETRLPSKRSNMTGAAKGNTMSGKIGDKVYLILFNARKGILENKQFFEFEWTPNFLEEFLVQFYSDYDCPKEVVLPVDVDSGLKDFFKKLDGEVVVPKVGEKLKLLELVLKNVEVAVFGDNQKIVDLRDKLNLAFLPRVIECFDVSHLSGTSTVASMVQFRDGKADKNNYRRFKIRTVEGNDDYASMREVMSRRYTKLKKDNLAMPDLIVVDGGKGQLGVAVEVLKGLDLGLPVIGLAKREEEVFFPGERKSVRLDSKGKALRLLQEIRDEAHRFAISYQRLLRSKNIGRGD